MSGGRIRILALVALVGCGVEEHPDWAGATSEVGDGGGDSSGGEASTSGDDTGTASTASGDGDDTTSGDGDGDGTTGDGDGTTAGDGDGTTTGDGDGTTTGDGDGDGTTTGDGDGDGTTTGDGDGDGTTTGDGDGDGALAVDACPADPDLVLCYRFESLVSGVSPDGSGNGNHLTTTNATLGTGIAGSALATIATSTAAATTGLIPLSEFTAAAWVNPDAIPTVERWGVLSKEGTFSLVVNPTNGSIFCSVTGIGGVGTASVQVGAWQHIACTFEPTIIRIYVDGVLSLSAPYGPSLLQMTDLPFSVGRSTAESFVGSIDGVQFYSRALTESELCVLAGNLAC